MESEKCCTQRLTIIHYQLFILLIWPAVDGLRYDFCIRNGRWVERRPAPRHLQRQPREVDDAAIAAIAAHVVRGPHEDTINWAWLNAQRAEHALRVIDGIARDLEAFAVLNALLTDVNAIHRARFCALVASDTGGEIKPMEATITRCDRNRQFGILEVLRERFALWAIRLNPSSKRDPHAVCHGVNRFHNIAHPGPNSLHLVDHGAAYFLASSITARSAQEFVRLHHSPAAFRR